MMCPKSGSKFEAELVSLFLTDYSSQIMIHSYKGLKIEQENFQVLLNLFFLTKSYSVDL